MPSIDDAKLAETMAKYYPDLVCKYYPDQPSYTPPPSSKPSTPPTIEESLAKLGDSIDKLELVTKRLVAKRLAASTTNLVSITSQTTFTKNESNDHTSNNKTNITDTTTAVVTAQNTTTVNDATTPPNTQPNIIMPLPNNNGQIHTPTPKNPMAKLLTVSVSSMAKIQNVVPAQIIILESSFSLVSWSLARSKGLIHLVSLSIS
ncbi:hypothetical protein Tco_1535312 [Tanacetum coccineum]